MVAIIFVVIVFSFIQSMFGMGLLIFGTPSLLLLGYEFTEVLWALLPASLSISLVQVLESSEPMDNFRKSFLIFCLPVLGVTLGLYIYFKPDIYFEIILGLLMLVFAITRIYPVRLYKVTRVFQKHTTLTMVIMGVVHGLSNMGGSVLAIVANSHYTNKQQIRNSVSFCYLLFGVLQLLLLYFFSQDGLSFASFYLCPLALGVYLILGRKSFKSLKNEMFHHLFTGFILVYAGLLLGRASGYI